MHEHLDFGTEARSPLSFSITLMVHTETLNPDHTTMTNNCLLVPTLPMYSVRGQWKRQFTHFHFTTIKRVTTASKTRLVKLLEALANLLERLCSPS